MESLLFFLNSGAVVVLAIMALRDERRKAGVPARSYFRFREDSAPIPDATADLGLKRAGRPR